VYETLPFSSTANMATMCVCEVKFITFNVHRKSAYVTVIHTK